MNPNNQDNQLPPLGDPNTNRNDQLFAPRFNIPNQNIGGVPGAVSQQSQQNQSQTPIQPTPVSPAQQQSPVNSQQRTGAAYPWAPTPANESHPAQPASPTSTERFPLPPPAATAQTPAGNMPQYGGQMAELPPLAAGINPQQPSGGQMPKAKKPKKSLMKLLFGTLIALAFLALVGAAILVVLQSSKQKTKTTSTVIKTVTYTTDQVKKLTASKQLTATALQKVDATNTFYSAFRTASQQPVAQTMWDVYYTKNKKDVRGDQYNLYGVTTDYRTKVYNYDEDDYSNIGIIQTRCLADKQYIFNGSKLSGASASWQQASDSTNCSLASVATRMNDGMNTGGLTAEQSNTFIQQLNKTGSVKVNSMSLTTQKGAQYIKFDVSVTPKLKTKGVYWGMQNFMAAFQATGLNAAKYPYTYFGASGDGMSLQYYVDPGTMLPVYAAAVSTPALNAAGNTVTPTSYSHRFIEYAFPGSVPATNLNDHNLITFTTWPDHL